MKRIEFLRAKWSEAVVVHAMHHDAAVASGVDLFDHLAGADPTAKKIYLDWVLKNYCAGIFRAEDTERVAVTLASFHKNKRRLSEDQRDIGFYKTETDLWRHLSEQGFIEKSTSGKDEKRAQREKAYAESLVVEEDGWRKAVVQSHFAARWWGLGTRWCTTGANGSHFKYYNEQGRLVVFVSPEGEKWQLHLRTLSFCNSEDRLVDFVQVVARMPQRFRDIIRHRIEEVIASAVDSPSYLNWRSGQAYETFMSWCKAVGVDDMSAVVAVFHKAARNELQSLRRADGWVLSRTYGSCARHFYMQKLNSGAMLEVELHHQDMFVVSDPDDEEFVIHSKNMGTQVRSFFDKLPYPIRDSLLMIVVKSFDYDGEECYNLGELTFIDQMMHASPASAYSDGLWKRWSSLAADHGKYGFAFTKIPSEVMSPKIASVFAKRSLIDHIPKEMVTRELLLEASQASVERFVSNANFGDFTSEELALIFSGGPTYANLDKIPKVFQTTAMYSKIAQVRPFSYEHLVRRLESGVLATDAALHDINLDLARIAVRHQPMVVSQVKIGLPRDVYLEMVKSSPSLLHFVPLEFRDMELCLAALSSNWLDSLCHCPAWVINEFRNENDGNHGITAGYRPSKRVAVLLTNYQPREVGVDCLLPPFEAPHL